MKKIAVLLYLFLATAASATDSTPYDDPPDGKVSAIGSIIETETIRCEVMSPYAIQCVNIGRVCRAWRAAKRIDYSKTFGCALESSPNHPCPPWEDRTKQIDADTKSGLSSMCTTLQMGGF